MNHSSQDAFFVNNEWRIRCTEIVELVTHYLDDGLDDHDLKAFRHHITHCEGCSAFVDQISKTIRLTEVASQRSIIVQPLPANFDELARELRRRALNG